MFTVLRAGDATRLVANGPTAVTSTLMVLLVTAA